MAEKRGQYVYNDDGTVSTLVSIAGAEDSGGGAVGTNLKSSQILAPVDIQSRYATTIQTHAGATVAPNAGSDSSTWIDCDGFSEVAITLMNSAGTASKANLSWSHDAATVQGFDSGVIPSGTDWQRAGSTTVKARYLKVTVRNEDATNPRTMSAWAYLKA